MAGRKNLGLADRQLHSRRDVAKVLAATGAGLRAAWSPGPAPAEARLEALMRQGLAEPVDLSRHKPGVGADITDIWLLACAEARERNTFVRLPPYPVRVSRTGMVRGIIGTPGKSRVLLTSDFIKTGFNSQFCILNPSFSQSYDDASADDVLYYGFDIVSNIASHSSIIGLANVAGGVIDRVNILASGVIVDSRPVVVDSLIDVYAAVRDLSIRRCALSNITGAYGKTKISAGGGGAIWVRNFSNNGSLSNNVTQNVDISHNIINHLTSDEALAVFGVRGVVRGVNIHRNVINGLKSNIGVYRATTVSIFPCDDGSGNNLGDTAAVYRNELSENIISDSSFLYSVVRIGNSADSTRECRDNRLIRNRITAYRSADPVLGPRAVWLSAGQVGPDPHDGCCVLRCIDGQPGKAYKGDFSGNTSQGDQVTAAPGSAHISIAIAGFQELRRPTVRGPGIFTGVAWCRSVQGGVVKASARAFYNVNVVRGTVWRVTRSGNPAYAAFSVDSSSGGSFTIEGTRGISASGLIFVASRAAPGTRITARNNSGQLGAGVALQIEQPSARVTAMLNNFDGASLSAISGGKGRVSSRGNRWGVNYID